MSSDVVAGFGESRSFASFHPSASSSIARFRIALKSTATLLRSHRYHAQVILAGVTFALRLFPCWHANTDAQLVATLCLSPAKERNSLRDELFTGLSCRSPQKISKFRPLSPLSIGSVLLVLREKSCRGVGAGRAEAPGRRDTLSSVVSALHPRLPVAFYCRRTEVRRKKTYDHGRIPNNVTAAVHQHARRRIEFHELDPEE
jgi:hypothetical protein